MTLNNNDLSKIVKWFRATKKGSPSRIINELFEDGVRRIVLLWPDDTFIRVIYPINNGSITFEIKREWSGECGVVSKDDLETFMNQINKDLEIIGENV